jgi:hypothetical protein
VGSAHAAEARVVLVFDVVVEGEREGGGEFLDDRVGAVGEGLRRGHGERRLGLRGLHRGDQLVDLLRRRGGQSPVKPREPRRGVRGLPILQDEARERAGLFEKDLVRSRERVLDRLDAHGLAKPPLVRGWRASGLRGALFGAALRAVGVRGLRGG